MLRLVRTSSDINTFAGFSNCLLKRMQKRESKQRSILSMLNEIFIKHFTVFNVLTFIQLNHLKRTHYKADTSIRRTVCPGTDCFALAWIYLRKNLYKADISIKRTLFCTNDVHFIQILLYVKYLYLYYLLFIKNLQITYTFSH